ncbi:hypothetical protein ACWDUN_18000 [Mycobacterium sp. NPDC003323]
MSAIARKISTGTAACAIAAAATLSSTAVAQADIAPAPLAALGSQIGEAQCDPTTTDTCDPVGLPSASAVAAAAADPGFPDNLIQNEFWWLGRANPNAPPRETILEFQPMSLVPGFLKPLYGWFTGKWDVEICFLGLTGTLGPYGTATLSIGRGCN